MPNRILKESILDSPTLARLDDFAQDQFPRLLLLVDDWGCFNADSEAIKGRAYPKRKKVTPKVIEKVLQHFYDNGMLYMWRESDRVYGYWIGWDDHNYCNAAAVSEDGKQAKHRRKTPEPPWELVDQYVASFKNKLEQTRTKVFIPIPIPIPNPIPLREEREIKKPYGENGKEDPKGTVLLTDDERQKLTDKFGEEESREKIAEAHEYLGGKGKGNSYASHYLMILSWVRLEKKRAHQQQARASPKSHVHDQRCRDFGFCPEAR